MLKKILFCLMLTGLALPFLGNQASANEDKQLARCCWGINIGIYPGYGGCGPCYAPYYRGYYPYPYPCCGYPYPCWVW